MTPKDWLINIDNIADHIQTRTVVSEEQRWKRRCIYKLPASVTNLNKNAYRPQVVSFGPYHCKNVNLKPMEEHKDRAVCQFLRRSSNTIQSCWEFFKEAAEELMDAYEVDPLDHPDEFLMIMIRDGCFMLEIFQASLGEYEGYARNDPIFSKHGGVNVFPYIWRDMMLLENQLPMKVLYMLLQFQKGLAMEDKSSPILREIEKNADKLLYQFLSPGSTREAPSNCLHILDMHRKVMIGSSKENDTMPTPKFWGGTDIGPATELDKAGIKFIKSGSRSINDITFEKGVLRLPTIIVDDSTESLYLNLMAFERFHVGAGKEVTSFAYFMDNMIDDAQDIKLLRSKDIIQNVVGSDKAVARLFNSLSKDITLDLNSSHLRQVYKNVNDYCNKCWPRQRARLIDTYSIIAHSTSPWALPSVLAAILLFALTTIQTVYSSLSYYKQK